MKNIKKAMCAVLSVLMISCVFAFASCSGGSDETKPAVPDASADENTAGDNSKSLSSFANVSKQSAKNAPQFVLATANEEYAAGDTVMVTVILNNAPNTADFDFYITADTAEYVENITASIGSMQIMADGSEETFRMMGVVATTENIDGKQLADVKFKIPDTARSGDVITFSGKTADFDKGRTSDGAKVDSITSSLVDPVLTIKIK